MSQGVPTFGDAPVANASDADAVDAAVAGLRERKKQATRRAIQQAALRLVAERGLANVTVDDIAAAVDVAPRTFFNYFSAKEDALLARDPEKRAAVIAALAARPAEESPLAALHAVLVGQADQMAAQADDWTLRMQLVEKYPQLLPRHLAGFAEGERAMAEAIAARTGVSREESLYPDLVAAAAIAAMRTAMAHWRARPGSRPLAEHIDDAFRELAEGLPKPVAKTRSPQTNISGVERTRRRTGDKA
jgi:AcrR family transcriptional regulator